MQNKAWHAVRKLYWLVEAGGICDVLANPASLEGSAVVQPVVRPMVEGSKVYVS